MNLKFNAIIFDLGGVILNIDYTKTINFFKQLGVANFDELYTQAKQNHIFDQFEKGQITEDEFRDYIKTKANVKLSNQQIDDAWNAMLLDLPEHRIHFLEQLKKKYPIYLYSNTNAIHYKAFQNIIKQQYGTADLLENIFNDTFYSHLIGLRKPHKEGFLYIIEKHNLKPETTLFIDDTEQHINGGKKVGLKTLWLKDKDVTELF
jgi:putative hydrolase of the HAD superfamily